MAENFKRHPVQHFFIMDRVQKRFIARIMSVVIAASLITMLIVVLSYYLKYRTGYFYYMSEQLDGDLIRHNIWSLILPSAGPALLVAISVGMYASFYGSRKIALPLFKIKQWATSMFAGNLHYKVTLREGDDLFELETSCMQISKKYNELFTNMDSLLKNDSLDDTARIGKIKEILSGINLG